MTLVSGWCMIRDPEQHKKCPKNFTFGQCECKCAHEGERAALEPVKELGTRKKDRPSRG